MSFRILVYRIGSLGDTVVALPAMRRVQTCFPQAHLTLLTDVQPGGAGVSPRAVLDGAGLFDEFLEYPAVPGAEGLMPKARRALGILRRIRAGRFDTLVYLAPSERSAAQVRRDRLFFRLAGIRRIIGMEGFRPMPAKIPGRPVPAVPFEADLLLARLARSGLPVPAEGAGDMDPRLTAADRERLALWLRDQPSDGGRSWIAVGPGSKMPAKVWPEERYRAVVNRLIDQFDPWPVVFGGREERGLGRRLIEAWGRGYNAMGTLDVRSAMAAMGRCRLFVGNDSGAMHMAAAVRTSCVAIFSARSYPGQWYPYGREHVIFRHSVSCELCLLERCETEGMRCVLETTVDDVYAACRKILLADGPR